MTTQTIITDPFTQAYDALWDVLEAHPAFGDRFKLANRIKFTGNRTQDDPRKDNVGVGDLPEIDIRPTGGPTDLWFTHTDSRAVRHFQIGITTQDLRADRGLFPLDWELLRALAKLEGNLGLPFVVDVTLEEVDHALEGTDFNRGTSRWVAVFDVVVTFMFDRKKDLLAEEPQSTTTPARAPEAATV